MKRLVIDFVFKATDEEVEAIEARLNEDKTLLAKVMHLLTDRHPENVERDVGAWSEEVEWTHGPEDENDGCWRVKIPGAIDPQFTLALQNKPTGPSV